MVSNAAPELRQGTAFDVCTLFDPYNTKINGSTEFVDALLITLLSFSSTARLLPTIPFGGKDATFPPNGILRPVKGLTQSETDTLLNRKSNPKKKLRIFHMSVT